MAILIANGNNAQQPEYVDIQRELTAELIEHWEELHINISVSDPEEVDPDDCDKDEIRPTTSSGLLFEVCLQSGSFISW